MEKLASRHAISELFNWISLMENVIEEDEENLKSAVGSNVIQDYLQKYKVEVAQNLKMSPKSIFKLNERHFNCKSAAFVFFSLSLSVI